MTEGHDIRPLVISHIGFVQNADETDDERSGVFARQPARNAHAFAVRDKSHVLTPDVELDIVNPNRRYHHFITLFALGRTSSQVRSRVKGGRRDVLQIKHSFTTISGEAA